MQGPNFQYWGSLSILPTAPPSRLLPHQNWQGPQWLVESDGQFKVLILFHPSTHQPDVTCTPFFHSLGNAFFTWLQFTWFLPLPWLMLISLVWGPPLLLPLKCWSILGFVFGPLLYLHPVFQWCHPLSNTRNMLMVSKPPHWTSPFELQAWMVNVFFFLLLHVYYIQYRTPGLSPECLPISVKLVHLSSCLSPQFTSYCLLSLTTHFQGNSHQFFRTLYQNLAPSFIPGAATLNRAMLTSHWDYFTASSLLCLSSFSRVEGNWLSTTVM